MKATFVGGGSHRLLGILRSAMAVPGIFDGGEIHLYDLDIHRAEAMGRMLQKTPEWGQARCRVSWGASLQDALEGAHAVGVILMAGSRRTFALGDQACLAHGFLPSDNVSPNGAFLAVKGGPTILGIAREMERLCPTAWLLDFANPVGVLSGMVNNHTRIKALGVCAGYTNHQWDLARILLGKDEQCPDFNVDVAGINHLSFILSGSLHGRDLFKLLDERLAGAWEVPELQPCWSPGMQENIRMAVRRIAEVYQKLGALIFSTEGDGMMHLFYEETLEKALKEHRPASAAEIEADLAGALAERAAADRRFREWVESPLDPAFWASEGNTDMTLRRQDEDIFVKALTGIAGTAEVKIATSRPNRGAVAGFHERAPLEYSQLLLRDRIRAAGDYQVPDVVHGLISALATHQMMLGDAIASEDPRRLAHALLAYPVRPYSQAARALYRDLAAINADEMPTGLRAVGEYL